MLFARRNANAQDNTQRTNQIRVVIVGGTARFLRVISNLRALLMPINRFNRVVDIQDVGFVQQGFIYGAFLFRKPLVPLRVGSPLERSSHAYPRKPFFEIRVVRNSLDHFATH